MQYKQKRLKRLGSNINETLKCADDDFVYQHVEMTNTETGEIVIVENKGGNPVIKSKEVKILYLKKLIY